MTNKKPSLQDLENQNNEFKLLFDTIKEGIYFTNNGILTNVNKAFCELFGYTKNELIGMPAWNLAKKEFQNEVREEFIQRLQSKNDSPVETTCMRKNGEIFLAEISVSSQTDTTQNYGVVRDLSVINKKEKELIASKEKAEESKLFYKQIFEKSPVGIAHVKPDGRFTRINKKFCEIIGYTEEELLKINFVSISCPDDLKKEEVLISKILNNEINSYTLEKRYLHKKGHIIWVNLNSNAVRDINGYVLFGIASITDITDRIKLQKELIAAKEKAEEASRLKTKFLNNMSHEIRTPMNGIIGFSNMFDKPDLSEEKRKYYSKIVQKCSHQLLRIIDDILEISTLEIRQAKLNETDLCLNDLLMELFTIFNLKSKERNIPLYLIKALQDDQSHIISDKTKLNKILGNLLENALKFTSEGFIEFGYLLENANLILYVKDTGIGISPKNHNIIFERFSQEHTEITPKDGGLGLGLSICKENAELLGGNITLESEKGKGSGFYVTIPFKPALNKKDNGTTDDISYFEKTDDKYTILIAEDEEVNYLYIEVLFEDEIEGDYNLIHAKNGKEAVEICTKNNNIDLVLMDMKMPLMNGHEATEKIKEKFPNLPIIAQTAYSTESDKQLALKYGCDDFISKPIDKEKLFGMIIKYLKMG